MNDIIIKLRRFANAQFPIPQRGTARMNVVANENKIIEAGSYEYVRLNINIKMPKSCVCILYPKLSCNIDKDGTDYNDPILITNECESVTFISYNLSEEPYEIKNGDIIGTMKFFKALDIKKTYYDQGDERSLVVHGGV